MTGDSLDDENQNNGLDVSGDNDRTTVYVSDDGEELTFAQIALASAKDPGVDVAETDEGYMISGKLFMQKPDRDT